MKSLKKFLALALALALCFAMALPAMAEDQTFELKMEDNTFEHTYKIYQIFTGDLSGTEGNYVLSNVKYGSSGYNNGTAGAPVPDDVLALFEKNGKYYENANLFAKENVNGLTPFQLPDDKGTSWDGNSIDVAPGYYIIVDETEGNDNIDEKEADSAYIVQVVGPTTVKPKTTVPELNKTTDPDPGDKYQLSEGEALKTATDKYGHKVGEIFPFTLTASIPVEHLDKFEHYMLKFSDTMDDGLTFEVSKGFEVKIGDVVVTDGYTLSGSVAENGVLQAEDVPGANFELVFQDILDTIKKNDSLTIPKTGNLVVTVKYWAYLNENALVWDTDPNGNTNTAHLEFSRDPNDETDHGKTPDDVVTIFTFDLDGFKKNENGEALPGAGFTLYTVNDEGKKGEVIPLYTNQAGKYFVWEETTENPVPSTLNRVVASENNKADEIRSDENGNFIINGLRPGEYIISETTTPTSYNTIWDMKVTVTITGYSKNAEGKDIPTLNVKKEYIETTGMNPPPATQDQPKDADNTEVEITNKKGTLLPSTGGIGTTIFYAVGGALVVGAGILLFVKKRMGSKG